MQEFNSSELLSMRIKPESTDDIYSVSYKYMLADRLADMYVIGQGNQRRKRRATGSVQTQVGLVIINLCCYIFYAYNLLFLVVFLSSLLLGKSYFV